MPGKEIGRRLTRLVNRRDIVPRVPGMGYAHAGLPQRITAGLALESFALGAGKGRDLRPEGALTKAVPWTAVHACDRYVENLEAVRRLQSGPAAASHRPMAQ